MIGIEELSGEILGEILIGESWLVVPFHELRHCGVGVF